MLVTDVFRIRQDKCITWIDFVIRADENASDQSTFFKNKTQLQNEIGQKFAGILDWVTRILLFFSRSPQFWFVLIQSKTHIFQPWIGNYFYDLTSLNFLKAWFKESTYLYSTCFNRNMLIAYLSVHWDIYLDKTKCWYPHR